MTPEILTPDLTIHFSRQLSDSETEALFRFEPNPFGVTGLNFQWLGKDHHFIGRLDGQPLSHVGLVKAHLMAGGEHLEIAGVGAVITRPEARNRHFAQRLLSESMHYARHEWGCDFGVLFCWPYNTPFYARQGWQLIQEPVSVFQPGGMLPAPLDCMYLPLTGRAWPGGEVCIPVLPW